MTDNEDLFAQKLKKAALSKDPHELEMLSKEDDYFIRANVARNPSTPDHILIRLAFDSRSYVSYSLRQYNTTCSEEISILVRAARFCRYDSRLMNWLKYSPSGPGSVYH